MRPRIYIHRAGPWAPQFLDAANLARLAAFAEIVSDAGLAAPLSADALEERLAGCAAILSLNGFGAEDLSAEIVERIEGLRLICIAHYWGLNHFGDVRRRGRIPVVEGSNVGTLAVAEWIVAAVLAHVRRLHVFDARLKGGSAWGEPRRDAGLVHGLTVGLVGFGRIGRAAARYLQVMGCRTIGFSQSQPARRLVDHGVEPVTLETLLETADIIVLGHRVTDATRNLLNRDQLWRIRPGALLVNAARAELYDERDLIDALAEGRFHAALDVFHREPLPIDDALRGSDHVLLTPHIAGNNTPMFRRCAADAIDTLEAFFRSGQAVDHALDLPG